MNQNYLIQITTQTALGTSHLKSGQETSVPTYQENRWAKKYICILEKRKIYWRTENCLPYLFTDFDAPSRSDAVSMGIQVLFVVPLQL
jgi:hypothetical protein